MARDSLPIPSRVVPASEFVLGPLTIGAARKTIEAKLDCTQHLNSGVLLTLTFEISYDGGATWDFVTSTGRPGGEVFDEHGVVDNNIRFTMTLAPERGTRRLVRCKVSLENGSFVTSGGKIEVLD